MNEMKTRTVNLAEIAVVVEEHVSTSDDLSSDVLPANAARQRAQSMGTLTCDIGDVRVIVCTPPEVVFILNHMVVKSILIFLELIRKEKY